jgi:hypothetical protein
MVNIRTSKKRKSNYNSSRSRLSRRVKRGGVLEGQNEAVRLLGQLSSRFGFDTLAHGLGFNKQEPIVEDAKGEEATTQRIAYVKPTSDEYYLALSHQIINDFPFITPKSIANGAIDMTEWDQALPADRNKSDDLQLNTILQDMKDYQIEQYRKLLQKSKPEYPYARKQTATDKEKLKIKELEEEKERLRREAAAPNKTGFIDDDQGHGPVYVGKR